MTVESIVEAMTDDEAEQLGRLWAMRQYAIEIGLFAERQLIADNALKQGDRRFYNRDEWRRLTNSS